MKKLIIALCLGLFINQSQAQDTTGVKTIQNLDAKSKTTYFSLESGKEVKETEAWDLAFKATTVKLNNSGTAKNKVAVATLKATTFDKVVKAPESGYQEDTQSTSGIPSGSGNGWYTYDMGTHQVLPIEDRVFVVKTSSGKFVKLKFESYYLNGDEAEETGYYSFKYATVK
ncbi:MAG: hypothetical protein EOO92_12555 [Pedobacter sp.]|nr:MAG: hypothetical protein EOO92_12555 [Pedobacter sp.]